MQRWPVVLLLVLAVIVLLSPGIVGRLAEKNIEDSIDWAEADNPGVRVATEIFQRGWFTSAGRHRVILEGGRFRAASEKYLATSGNMQLPSLIIDTRLDHGLLPVSSLGRDEGSLVPGLASTVSRFQLDPGNGEPIEIPGVLYSFVGLSGASDAHLLLEPGSFDYDGAAFRWQGTDMVVKTNPAAGTRAIDGVIRDLSLESDGLQGQFASLAVNTDQVRSEFGFNVGSAKVTLNDFKMSSYGNSTGAKQLLITAESGVDDERVSGTTSISVAGLTVWSDDVIDAELRISVAGFDAPSLGIIVAALKEAQGADDPEAAMLDMYPRIETEVQQLFRRGMQFNIEQLNVTLPQGVIATNVALDFAASDPDDAFSWPGVLLNMTASVDLRVPIEMYDYFSSLVTEGSTLVALGFLKKDGTDYVMDADYAKGLVNVNGAPMPIPIPGL